MEANFKRLYMLKMKLRYAKACRMSMDLRVRWFFCSYCK